MRTRQRILLWTGLAAIALSQWASATNYYVAASGSTPTPPWTNWEWAHTNLIEVVARTRDGDTVYVTNNATYCLTNQVNITYAITVRSWAPDGGLDRTNTILNGNYPNTTNRCVRLNHTNALVAGFTITNGCITDDSGGGVYLQRGHLRDCIVIGNRGYLPYSGGFDWQGGGGIYMGYDTGPGSVSNCIISGNICSNNGGGIIVGHGGPWIISGCTISGNTATNAAAGYGGGIQATWAQGLEIVNCVIASNYSNGRGGGVNLRYGWNRMSNCTVIGNYAARAAGGGITLETGSTSTNTVRNCLVMGNTSANPGNDFGGGIDLRNNNAIVQNCTICSNYASYGGGINCDVGNVYVENCVIWGNWPDPTQNYYISGGTPSFSNNCVQSGSALNTYGTNNIWVDPQFVGASNNNYHVLWTSPCVNAGANRDWMTSAGDLDGHSRIDRFSGIVDMGTYEYLPQGTIFFLP